MDTTRATGETAALSQLVEEVHDLHFRRSPELPRSQRDELSSHLNTVIWLKHHFDTTPDAMLASLQAILPQFHALACAKGHLSLALKAFREARYEDFTRELAKAEQLYADNLPKRT